MKQTLTFLVIGLIISCSNPKKDDKTILYPNRTLDPDRYNVGFLIMDGTYNTEFTAPFDIYQHTIFRENIKAMNVFSVAASLDPITTFEGLKIMPDFSYQEDDLPQIDILVVPSAEHHIDSDLENEDLLNFVRRVSKTALYVTSHCDGAFVLAKSGILNDVESTTFPADIELYRATFPNLIIHDSVYFVHDGRFITSSGGAKSFEASLYLVEYLYGKEVANSIAKGLVINWNLETVPHLVVKGED